MFPRLLSLFLCFFLSLTALADSSFQEGFCEQWGEFVIVLKEPVVSRTVVENATQRARSAEGESPLSDADCGLSLFSVTGSPAPTLRWVDQNKIRVEFAPGSSPATEFRLVFHPGTTYLSGAPLASPAFSFRCKPVSLSARWLDDHWGGAALVSAAARDTQEAQQLATHYEGLQVHFRRMRHVPLVGWVCTGTVPASLRPATLSDGFAKFRQVLELLVAQSPPEELSEDSPLPQCLVAVPEHPLVPGATYELAVTAAEGSGFTSEHLALGALPEALGVSLERELVAEAGKLPYTLLKLRFSHPVPEGQLRALWRRLELRLNEQAALLQEDGTYRAEWASASGELAAATLQLRGLIPCESQLSQWRAGRRYHYAPKGCAMGLEMVLQSTQPLELSLQLPADVQTRHRLALMQPQTLSASISPAAPALTGNGCNLLAFSGSHVLQLPLINMAEVRAQAFHWDAASAARLLPALSHALRDDTLYGEIFRRHAWMRRRAQEGLSTEGWMGDDARSEAFRALKLLHEERKASDPLRAQVLAAATAFEPQSLALQTGAEGSGLVARATAALDLDQLTANQLRPGLYLVALTCRPSAEVVQALAACGVEPDDPGLEYSVDVLVQVTDMSLRRGMDRLLVNSLATGQPLNGGELRLYALPEDKPHADEAARVAAAAEEAQLVEGLSALPV